MYICIDVVDPTLQLRFILTYRRADLYSFELYSHIYLPKNILTCYWDSIHIYGTKAVGIVILCEGRILGFCQRNQASAQQRSVLPSKLFVLVQAISVNILSLIYFPYS